MPVPNTKYIRLRLRGCPKRAVFFPINPKKLPCISYTYHMVFLSLSTFILLFPLSILPPMVIGIFIDRGNASLVYTDGLVSRVTGHHYVGRPHQKAVKRIMVLRQYFLYNSWFFPTLSRAYPGVQPNRRIGRHSSTGIPSPIRQPFLLLIHIRPFNRWIYPFIKWLVQNPMSSPNL